jgi:DNA-binding winged helix-turn-helix (wHTH) protein
MPDGDQKVQRLCRRCGEEIERADDLDRECDNDRHRPIVFVAGEPRQLTPTCWHLFMLLYRRRGTVVSSEALLRPQREILRRLRKALDGSRYAIVNHRGVGYELIVTSEHDPASATAAMPDEDQPETGDPQPRVAATEQAVIDHYLAGASLRKTGDRFGMPWWRVRTTLVRAGIPRRPARRPLGSRAPRYGRRTRPRTLPSSRIISPAFHYVGPGLVLASPGRVWPQFWLVRASTGDALILEKTDGRSRLPIGLSGAARRVTKLAGCAHIHGDDSSTGTTDHPDLEETAVRRSRTALRLQI